MRIFSFNNYQNKQNFQARLFAIHSDLGSAKCLGQVLGDIFVDADITQKKRRYVIRLFESITNKVLAAFYVVESRSAKVLISSLKQAVKCAKTTDGKPVRFEYIRNVPNLVEENVS